MLSLIVATAILASAPPDTALDRALLARLDHAVIASFDPTASAFSTKERMLDLPALEYAMRMARHGGPEGEAWRDRTTSTLTWADQLRDSVGGGYMHALKNKDPMDPSFDKWLVDNAVMLEVQLDAYWLGWGDSHLHVAREIAAYMDRVMVDPRGGFLLGQIGPHMLQAYPTGIGAVAYLRYHRATGQRPWRDFALRSLDLTWEAGWDSAAGFIRFAEVGNNSAGLLVDLTAMGRGFLEAYDLMHRPQDLERATTIGNYILARCPDRENGGFYSVALGINSKTFRIMRRSRDPIQNAEAAAFLLQLAAVTSDERFTAAARNAIAAFASESAQKGKNAASFALALDALFEPEAPRPAVSAEAVDAHPPRPRSKRYR